MRSIVDRLQREPVLLTSLVAAIVNLLVVFGVPITEEAKAGILTVFNSVAALFARSQVVPVVSVEDTPAV